MPRVTIASLQRRIAELTVANARLRSQLQPHIAVAREGANDTLKVWFKENFDREVVLRCLTSEGEMLYDEDMTVCSLPDGVRSPEGGEEAIEYALVPVRVHRVLFETEDLV